MTSSTKLGHLLRSVLLLLSLQDGFCYLAVLHRQSGEWRLPKVLQAGGPLPSIEKLQQLFPDISPPYLLQLEQFNIDSPHISADTVPPSWRDNIVRLHLVNTNVKEITSGALLRLVEFGVLEINMRDNKRLRQLRLPSGFNIKSLRVEGREFEELTIGDDCNIRKTIQLKDTGLTQLYFPAGFSAASVFVIGNKLLQKLQFQQNALVRKELGVYTNAELKLIEIPAHFKVPNIMILSNPALKYMKLGVALEVSDFTMMRNDAIEVLQFGAGSRARQTIYLKGNRALRTVLIPEKTLMMRPHLTIDKITCDCNMDVMYRFLRFAVDTGFLSTLLKDSANSPRCEGPAPLAGKFISDVSELAWSNANRNCQPFTTHEPVFLPPTTTSTTTTTTTTTQRSVDTTTIDWWKPLETSRPTTTTTTTPQPVTLPPGLGTTVRWVTLPPLWSFTTDERDRNRLEKGGYNEVEPEEDKLFNTVPPPGQADVARHSSSGTALRLTLLSLILMR